MDLVSIEKLYSHHIRPIIICIKFKSIKQIKESKICNTVNNKVSSYEAREMYERALMLQTEYKHYITGMLLLYYASIV